MDLDEEMKTAEVHTDDTIVGVVVAAAQRLRIGERPRMGDVQNLTVVTMTGANTVNAANWLLLRIEFVGEHKRVFQRTQSGSWRASQEMSHGADVLLTAHSDGAIAVRGEDPTTTAVRERHVQSHPHLLNLYGAGGRMCVCEEGALFQDFVQDQESYKSVLRVFYGVLLGLQFMHERGIAHGAVNIQHIVVGVNQKGKLLTRFPIGGEQPEIEPEAKAFANEQERPQVQAQFRADEDAFVYCMTQVITTFLSGLNEFDEAERVFVEFLRAAHAVLAAIPPVGAEVGDAPQRHMRRATDKLKKLADLEAGACKTRVRVGAQ